MEVLRWALIMNVNHVWCPTWPLFHWWTYLSIHFLFCLFQQIGWQRTVSSGIPCLMIIYFCRGGSYSIRTSLTKFPCADLLFTRIGFTYIFRNFTKSSRRADTQNRSVQFAKFFLVYWSLALAPERRTILLQTTLYSSDVITPIFIILVWSRFAVVSSYSPNFNGPRYQQHFPWHLSLLRWLPGLMWVCC